MENVNVEGIGKLHTPVLSVDGEMLTRDVMWTTAGFTTALVSSLEGLGLLNLKGKKIVKFLLLTFLFSPTVDFLEYHHTFFLIVV